MSGLRLRALGAGLVLSLAACADPAVTITPVFDLPLDADAVPTGLDSITLSVAAAGAEQALASISFTPGAHVELTGVPFDDALVVHMTGFVGGGDVAYGRTCAFAVSPDGPVPTPHLLFARNVRFATVDATPRARTGGAAIATAGGAALLLGGAVRTVERYDPASATLTALGELDPRTGAVATPLGLGAGEQIAIVGGDGDGLIELIDPAARIDRLDEPRLARTALTATTLTDGRVIAIGGRDRGGVATGDLIELTPAAGTVEVRAAIARLVHPRAEHTATRLGDDVGAAVLIAGGRDATGPIAVAELWKPLSGELADPATFAPAMVVPRHGHVARLLPDGSVLVIGGLDGAGAPVRVLERFSIDAGFRAAGELPATSGVVELTATPLPDGRILIAGGRAAPGGPAVDTAVIARLDVIGGAVDVVATDRLAMPRADHQATLLCDGTVLVTGGTAAPTPLERYNPPALGRR